MNTQQGIKKGFTLIELVIVITVLAVIATIGYVGYSNMQERAANAAVLNTLRNGSELLEINFTRHRDYPPNLAGTEFIATEGVETVLYTNAPTIRVHRNLTGDQNAQLFLNACRANMPIIVDGTLYSTGCSFTGNSVHVSGQRTSNTHFRDPVRRIDASIDCSKAPVNVQQNCHAVSQTIVQQFEAQGGVWPVRVPRGGKEFTLPEPNTELVTKNATKFCLEARFNRYPDVTIGHIKSQDKSPQEGACPNDPELRYLPPESQVD